jgi:hypothetical protein
MLDLLTSVITGNVGVSLQRFAKLAAFAALTGVFLAIALVACAIGVFDWLEPRFGAVEAAAKLAGGAVVLAALASVPLWRKPKPPPPSAMSSLLELALAVGLGLLTERGRKRDAP